MRKGGVIALAGCCLAIAPVVGAPGEDASAAKKHRTTVRIVSPSIAKMLERRSIAIRVAAARTGRYRLHIASRHGRTLHVVSRPRDVRLKRGVQRMFRVRFTRRAGRNELSTCGEKRLVASVLRLRGKHSDPGRALRRARTYGAAPGCEDRDPAPRDPSYEEHCDPTDPSLCLLPWPNDHFTVRDSTTDTGRRLALDRDSMPKNRNGIPIDPEPYNRNDGFSPGALIVTRVVSMLTQKRLDENGIVPVTDIDRAFDKGQRIVVLNARTKRRHPIWAEADSSAQADHDRALLIRPAVNFEEGERYIVAIRDIRKSNGVKIATSQAFRQYRDRMLTKTEGFEARRNHYESIFATLADAGIDRGSLYLAWDFTVASERNLSERALTIRDDAFKQLGDTNLADMKVEGRAPEFEIEEVTPNPEEQLALRIEGKYTVPCYLNSPDCASGGTFSYPEGSKHGPPSIPEGSTTTARFQCNVPKSATTPGASRPSLYGHGLLGSRGEVNQGQLRDFGLEHNFIFCAADWIGMSCADLPDTDPSPDAIAEFLEKSGRGQLPNCDYQTVLTILEDMSNFPKLADRVQQGLVNFLYLGRLMVHPDGFSKDPNFQKDGQSLIDTRRLFYDGNSQGGIIGGALTALAVDHDRAVLGVPGMNYSTLLTRSTDWGTGRPPDGLDLPEYSWFMYEAYPQEEERQLIFSLIQTLWDRAEANGYAHHMTDDPLPNTPPHEVMLHVGLGDHQVAQVSAEVEARTIGAYARTPYVDPGRDSDREPHWGLSPIPSFPFTGSALVLWDIGPKREENGETVGTEVPPTTNTPPGESAGQDPHEFPRRSQAGREQKSAFLSIGGRIIDVCGARPCYAGTWTGP